MKHAVDFPTIYQETAVVTSCLLSCSLDTAGKGSKRFFFPVDRRDKGVLTPIDGMV